MKASETHNMNDQELSLEADRLRKQLYDLRCQAVTDKLENPRQIRTMRRDIARVLTEQRERQLKQQEGKA